MCLAPFWSTWNPAQWTQFALDLMAKSSARTTSFLVKVVLATIGPKDTTRKEPSWWTMCWTWFARRLKDAIASKDSN